MTETRPEYQTRRAVLPVVSDAEYLRAIQSRLIMMTQNDVMATLEALINRVGMKFVLAAVIEKLLRALDGGKDGD